MIRFKYTKHRQLWKKVKDSWNLVQKFGLTEAKTIIRRIDLNDTREIPNSCYACEYAVKNQNKTSSRCFKCPLDMDWCNNTNSSFYQLTFAIQEHNKEEFQRICEIIMNTKVKDGIEYD